MDNEESIRKFIRGTRFLWPLWTGPTLQKPRKKPLEISGLEIDPLEPIWVSYRLAYELLIIPLSQGVIDRDFIEIPHEKVDSYLLKRIYNAQSSIGPTIRKKLGKERLFYYLIENPEELIALMKTDHGKAMSEVAPTAQDLLDEEQTQWAEKMYDMLEKVVEKMSASKKSETIWDEFKLLMKEAIKVRNPTEDDLRDWKNKFKKYSEDYRSYFGRYAERNKISLDSIPALAWRGNKKFRNPRSKNIG